MSLRVVVVDDERLAREKLKRMLTHLADPEVEIIGEASDGPQAVQLIDRLRPDAVFLDIQMPGMTGFDVVRHLKFVPNVIFSTAYDQYAVRAFDVNAIDYLLKPYDAERLTKAVRKIGTHQAADTRIQNAAEEEWRRKGGFYFEKIPVRHGGKIRLLSVAEVSWFDSEHSITFGHTRDARHDVKYTLDELEKRLPPERWFRIHRSTLIHLNEIHEIIPWFNGAMKIKLRHFQQEEFFVSRHRAADFKKLLSL